jgi:serine/alanine adding enzyme
MTNQPATSEALRMDIRCHSGGANLAAHLDRVTEFVYRGAEVPLSSHPGWLMVLERGLGHVPYGLEVVDQGVTCGWLPLAYVRSLLFGKFLVSLPYLNYGGVLADDIQISRILIDRAIELADRLDANYLELRHVEANDHPGLPTRVSSKVHMKLALLSDPGQLWKQLPAKVRNQVRKGQKNELQVVWGGEELLGDFYQVFSRNMRDLGTPVFGRKLFREILRQFPGQAEICLVRGEQKPLASALLLHGKKVTEVPSASSLRAFNHTNANMLMYWNLLERAMIKGQAVFDFGRSTPEGNTFRFKKQWGAMPQQAIWQYHVRRGTVGDMRPENPRYQRFIRIWQRLPVGLTKLIGPMIVRGIP